MEKTGAALNVARLNVMGYDSFNGKPTMTTYKQFTLPMTAQKRRGVIVLLAFADKLQEKDLVEMTDKQLADLYWKGN